MKHSAKLSGIGSIGVIFLLGCGSTGSTPAVSTPSAAAPTSQPSATAVHWEQYSDDVFARAKKENRFVLLDLEAVWCHWCHVQDDITYVDPKVIALVNQRYIAVKVDQDARPDLSNRYENYGWPATIIFNADAGEIVKRSGYIPPRPMAAMLQAIIDDPTPGPSVGAEQKLEPTTQPALTPELTKELTQKLAATYDTAQGGWGTVHKFVDWDAVEYCLAAARGGDANAEHRARQTLDGGLALIDPVWGGAYQYSVGGGWDQPHFEKLMQFQAELMRIYAMAALQLGDAKYADAARHIRQYIATFLTSPEGAFYVSQDADLVDGQHSADYFAMDDAARRKRGVPRVDPHVYPRETGWGIVGLLEYYDATQNPADLADAVRAARWAMANRALGGGGFSHDSHDAAGPYLGDSLAMGRAFLALHQSTGDREWLDHAQAAADFMVSHFGNGAGAGSAFAGFNTAAAAAGETFKPEPHIDENVAAARFFNLLFHYTGNKADRDAAQAAMRFLATPSVARSRSLWIAGILLADDELSRDPLHVTVLGGRDDARAAALFATALRAPGGYRRIEWFDLAKDPPANADVHYPQLDHAAAFVCTANACSSPLADPEALAKKLRIAPPTPGSAANQ